MVLITGGRYAGKLDYARRCFPGYRICGRYQERVRELLDGGSDPWAEAALLIEEEKVAVLMDEIGCGLVPVDVDDRLFRETAGRIGCYLAKHAEEVHRVVLGIGMRLR